MESDTMQLSRPRTTAKDFFLNLGAIVALFTVVISFVNLTFTVINSAFPQITTYYYSTPSISFPVATLIIFFPIFILLMWLLEKEYVREPEKRSLGVRRWLTYITLFIAGLTLAGDLVTVLYYFLDGQELTAGFMLKVLTVFVVTLMVFMYYVSDIRNRLTIRSRGLWASVATVFILASIIWGFAVLGSPRTQQLKKYDLQKVTDLQMISSGVENYYTQKNALPDALEQISSVTYTVIPNDPQTNQPYMYKKTGTITYEVCATFNKASQSGSQSYPYYAGNWTHPAGSYCFSQTVTPAPGAAPAGKGI